MPKYHSLCVKTFTKQHVKDSIQNQTNRLYNIIIYKPIEYNKRQAALYT